MSTSDHDLRVTIGRLSMSQSSAGARSIEPADFAAAIEEAMAERLGTPDGTPAPPRGASIAGNVAAAIAPHVRPFMGPRRG